MKSANCELGNKQANLGKTFNAATGFSLPNGADRSPDASWVSRERWEALTPQERKTFPHFVLILLLSCAHPQTT